MSDFCKTCKKHFRDMGARYVDVLDEVINISESVLCENVECPKNKEASSVTADV